MKRVSEKRKARYKEELPIRIKLCERCGGTPIQSGNSIICAGGKCEECGNPPMHPEYPLTPHEKKHRSRGGELSEENSLMLCIKCHNKAHGIKVVISGPQWGARND